MDSEKWLQELEIFLSTEGQKPPQDISSSLLSKVRKDLNPSISLVASKLFFFHMTTAAVMLLFCPQLGVGPVLDVPLIMDWFMHFGALPCATFCGILFMAASTSVSALLLRRDELRVANRHRFTCVTLIVALSFSGLMLVGGKSDRWSYIFWICGAILGTWISLFSGARLRLGEAGYSTLLERSILLH